MRIGKPSPALVISIVALVFAMTGTGIAAKSLITGRQIKDGSITAKDIANGAITQKKLGKGAVASSNLAPGAVTGAAIGPNTITNGMIAPDAITSGKIAPNAVLGANLAAGAVTAGSLAPNAVTASALADGSVAPRNLATSGSSGKSRRGLRNIQPTFQICPNGVIVMSGSSCPVVRGWVKGDMEKVASFPVDLDGVPSQCTRTRTDMPFTLFGPADPGNLSPVLDGTYFAAKDYQPKSTSLIANANWGNVADVDTNLIGVEIISGKVPPGATDVSDLQSLAVTKTTGTGIVGNVLIQGTSARFDRTANQVFTAYAIACNTTASGRGAPTLTNFDVQGYFS